MEPAQAEDSTLPCINDPAASWIVARGCGTKSGLSRIVRFAGTAAMAATVIVAGAAVIVSMSGCGPATGPKGPVDPTPKACTACLDRCEAQSDSGQRQQCLQSCYAAECRNQ